MLFWEWIPEHHQISWLRKTLNKSLLQMIQEFTVLQVGIVERQVQPSRVVPAFHRRVLVLIPAALLPLQLPATIEDKHWTKSQHEYIPSLHSILHLGGVSGIFPFIESCTTANSPGSDGAHIWRRSHQTESPADAVVLLVCATTLRRYTMLTSSNSTFHSCISVMRERVIL